MFEEEKNRYSLFKQLRLNRRVVLRSILRLNLLTLELIHRTCSIKRKLSIYFTKLHVSKTRAWRVLSLC